MIAKRLMMVFGFVTLLGCIISGTTWAKNVNLVPPVQYQVVPILGTTLDYQQEPIGIVVRVEVILEKRRDTEGLRVLFQRNPGRFSPFAQRSVRSAITHVAEVAGLQPDSWTVRLVFPYPGVTLYGDSLSAMVGLSVLALAKGDPLSPDRALTGTITADGHIGVVGGVPHKIQAAYGSHFQRVLIPEEQHEGDRDWRTPFLMHVSPVRTLSQAYTALTDRPL